MIPKVLHRISFWFTPNEKPTHIHVNEVKDGTIISSFLAVARNRYPTTFKEDAPILMFPYASPIPGKPPRLYVGDPAGINAFYTTQMVLECEGKYFELKELP